MRNTVRSASAQACGALQSQNPRSWARVHTQTAGCSLTAQQPYNMCAHRDQALRRCSAQQSLHTNSLDEAGRCHGICGHHRAAHQQIIAHERVANTVDALGSYLSKL